MATPTQNSVPTTSFNPSSTGSGRYLADGVKWGGGLGSSVTLTFSIPFGTATFITGYQEFGAWYQVTQPEYTAIRSALSEWSGVAGVRFVEVADNNSTVGELRFALSDFVSGLAHAYLPNDNPRAGDVWFAEGSWNVDRSTVFRGDDDYHTILHEIGHALGLKHSFESPNAVPSQFDNYLYTVMSYTASPWSADGDGFASFYPTTPMYYDLVAIQAMYGRNPNHHAGNNIYTFNDGSTYFQTIDDAKGTDTIVYNGFDSSRIDLRIGHYCQVSEVVNFTSESSRSTVWIGPGTVLERAIGGQGNDVLIGNGSANVLTGRGGIDSLIGAGGADKFDFNTAFESGLFSGRDIISDFRHLIDKIDVSTIDASVGQGGNNAFLWRGGAQFSSSSTGEVRFQKFNFDGTSNDYTVVYFDTDSDIDAEFEIQLKGLVSLSKSDLIL